MGTSMGVRFGQDWRDRAGMGSPIGGSPTTLQWRHNGLDCVSNHQPHHCLFNRLFGRRTKKTSTFRVTGLCAGNSPVPGVQWRGKCFYLMTLSWSLSRIRAVYIEMHGSCSTKDGTAVGQQRWVFSGAWPKVNQASRVPHQSLTSIGLAVSTQTPRLAENYFPPRLLQMPCC